MRISYLLDNFVTCQLGLFNNFLYTEPCRTSLKTFTGYPRSLSLVPVQSTMLSYTNSLQ